jgi:acetyl esterase/lipase
MSAVDDVVARIQSVYGGWGRDTTVQQMRDDWDRLFSASAIEAIVRHDSIGGVPVAWIAGDGASDERIFVYLHGGGYRIGSPASHADLVARISAASGATGLVIDYRLAPEHLFPAAIDDIVRVWAALAENRDVGAVSLVGDSAGGNLALASIQIMGARGLLLPAAVALLSPWTDLRMLGATYETRATADPIHSRKMLVSVARNYLGDADAASPLASPIDADLRGFPPMLIQVGDREVLLSDSEMLADRARSAGVDVDLTVWTGMIHVFQQFPTELPEAREAIDAIGAFLSAASGKPRSRV